jgi:pilus assembly protein CpaD
VVGGCWKQGPRFDAPFTLANATERHPIKVSQDEATLDLAVYRGSRGLDRTQKGQLYGFLQEYNSRGTARLVVKAPTGGPNETAAMRAYEDVRAVMRQAGISPSSVSLEPYFAGGDPYAPLRVSFLRSVAEGPDCPDWSENLARDPQNMPWPNKGVCHPTQSCRHGRQSGRPALPARRDAASERAPRRRVGQVRHWRVGRNGRPSKYLCQSALT